jgi:N-acetyl-1-D-myo-inositol-2-amino-2-deoxy-alpha-D-glucopyranoside deacetylase
MKTLLVIFAHPDDESHGPAGTLAKYAAEGVKVYYLCATRGEAGSVEDSFLAEGRSVAELRTAELEHAVYELGLAGVEFLGYRDSGMEGSVDNHHPESLYAAPLDEVAGRIAQHIQCLHPDAIITHDRYGWYGHPDHIKCYLATLRAYELLYGITVGAQPTREIQGDAPRLYASTFSKFLLKIMVHVMPLTGRNPRRHGQNQDVDLVEISRWDVRSTACISVGRYLTTKAAAIACHRSQKPLTHSKNPLMSAVLRWSNSVECFSRLYPVVAPHEGIETSLFAAEARTSLKLSTQEAPLLVESTPF